MPSLKTKFSVGLFVIIGMTTIIVFVLWLGMSQYFKEGRHYVAFFDESVQGLKKDSAVKYRGVSIGRVESIRVADDGKLIQILFNLDEPLIDHDKMVAQIKSIGITGIMFVELERMSPRDSVWTPKLTFKAKYPVIATRPSDMKQLLTDIYGILNTIKQVDIKGIADRIIETLDKAGQTLDDAEVKKVSENLQQTLARIREILDKEKWDTITTHIYQASENLPVLIADAGGTIQRLDRSLNHHNQNLSETITKFNNAAEAASDLMKNGNALVTDAHSRVARIDRQLLETLNTLEAASTNLNGLIGQIADQPSQILFSAPPPPKSIEPEEE
ncbi:MAG: MlaD family protein [Desulfobacterales bacterium]|jgi:phospholipid/cholesterol/gamma-HCH transport system substrate-binding protein